MDEQTNSNSQSNIQPETPSQSQVGSAWGGSNKLSPLHTYANDTISTIKDTDASLTRIRLMEEKKKMVGEQEPSHMWGWIVVVLVMIVCVGGAIWWYTRDRVPIIPAAPIVIEPTALLGYTGRIDVTTDTLTIADISQALNSISSTVAITWIRPVHTNGDAYTFPDLAGIWGDNIDATVSTYIQQFMIGGVMVGSTTVPFLAVKADESHALETMLAWEPTLRANFFALTGTTVISTTTTDTYYDAVDQGRHIRVSDSYADPILYGFFDKGIMVITTNPAVLMTLERF